MIPRILELKNFLSYGDPIQKIEFKDYSLICLSGKNGNGKSALLDAITWALWGQARKISGAAKADDGLLRLGQTRMMVSLTFDFGSATYRVRREFAKTHGKPYAALDFEVFDASGDKFLSLTDKTIRATQIKIEHLIGLDYDTFVNSAFLRQGQSNEFSKKSAKERKQILATILGLSKYDKLQHHALEKVRALQDEKKSLTALQERHALDIGKEATFTEQLKQEKTQLIAQQSTLDDLVTQNKQQEQALATLVAEKNGLMVLGQQQTQAKTLYAQHKDNLLGLVLEWKQIHTQSLTLPNLDALHDEKKKLWEQDKALLHLARQQMDIQEKILQTKDAHQKRFTQLKQSLDAAQNQQTLALQQAELAWNHHALVTKTTNQRMMELSTKQLEAGKTKAWLETTLQTAHKFNQQFTQIKTRFEKGRALYQSLVQRGNWTKTAMADLEQKQKIIHDHTNPACPLCDQLLTVKRKQFLAQQLEQDDSFLKHRLARIATLLKKLKELLVAQHDHVQAMTRQAEELARHELQRTDLEKNLVQINEELARVALDQKKLQEEGQVFLKQLDQAKKGLSALSSSGQDALNLDPTLKELTGTLSLLEQEKSALAVDPDLSKQIQEKLSKLETTIAHHLTIKQAQDKQAERRLMIGQLCKQLKELQKTIGSMDRQLATLNALEERENTIKQSLLAINQQTTQTMASKDKMVHVIGSLEYELTRLEKLKQEVSVNQDRIKMLDRTIEDYQALATAFSKNGIQALLIEEAIPEIEHEANAILSRLTNNQAQIFMESLRDLKSGGVKETLDIQIADAVGIRPYEMYSGGEAFRVDFALRIAISKLLARRAGTALQTLIIDEGFGSQDEDGLSHIMDALHAIQADFSKIIIVSHLPDFKHNFPVHFIVEKGPSGSVVNIEERG